MIYPITPVPKPRMTQRDKWAKRPPVMRYRAFCDEVILHGVKLPDNGAHVTFILPMPKSWSAKKKAKMHMQPHQQTPDVDNLQKALADAIHLQDCGIWDIRITKRWGYAGQINIVQDG